MTEDFDLVINQLFWRYLRSFRALRVSKIRFLMHSVPCFTIHEDQAIMIRGANVSFSPTEYISAIQLFCYSVPRSRSSPCLPFDDLFMEEVQRIVPLPPPKGIVPFRDQRFRWEEECFDFNDRDNHDLFFKPSPRKVSRCFNVTRSRSRLTFKGLEDSDGADVTERTRLFLLFNH